MQKKSKDPKRKFDNKCNVIKQTIKHGAQLSLISISPTNTNHAEYSKKVYESKNYKSMSIAVTRITNNATTMLLHLIVNHGVGLHKKFKRVAAGFDRDFVS